MRHAQLPLKVRQDFLPTECEDAVLNFVDDEDFLMLRRDRRSPGCDKHRRLAFDDSLRCNVAVIGVIPDADERVADIPGNLRTSRLDRRDEFFTIGIKGKALGSVNSGLGSGNDVSWSNVALIRSIEEQNANR